MKHLMMLFSIIIFLLPIAFAETKIFSGTAITDTDKIIDGNTFRFTYDDNTNKTFVYNPMQNLIVEKGKCNSNRIFRVCINSADYYDKNITTYVYYYKLDVKIYKLAGSLSTTSKISNNQLLPRESADFTITITNPSDFEIDNIKYTQDMNPFSVLEANGCALEGSKISWQGSLNSKYDKTCTAKIVAEKDGSYSLAGSLSYFNSYENENKSTDAVSVTVLPKQLKVTNMIDKDIEVRQPFYINVSVQNIHPSEKIDSYFTIGMPSNIDVVKYPPELSKDFNTFSIHFSLDPGSSSSYPFYIKASKEGDKPITKKFEYTIKGIQDAIENDTLINAVEPKPVIDFSSESYNLTPGQKFIVLVKLTNPSRMHQLDGMKASLDVSYNEKTEQTLSRLLPGDSYSIISKTFIIPDGAGIVSGNKTILLNLTVEYKFYETEKSLNKFLELKIKPSNTALSNATTKGSTQISKEAKSDEVAAPQPKSIDKTNTPIQTMAEKPEQSFFNKKALFMSIIIFATLLALAVIINIIRKRKKGASPPKEKALNEISEVLNK